MSEVSIPPQTPGESKPTPSSGEGILARWRSGIFVAVFMSIVLALLMGYRYQVDSRYNDWYLFQVARHTVMALSLVGDHAELEHGRDKLGDPRMVRSKLNAWLRGAETETPEDFLAAASEPLTAWEAWCYRSEEMRHTNAPGERGPRVQFILRSGHAIKVRELDETVREMEMEQRGTEAERAKMRQELREMQRQLNEYRTNPAVEDPDPTYMFVFIVVSECGAIEVMAIFLAAVVAFPTRWWKKLIGLIAGLPVMYGVNIFRLSCLAVIGAYDTEHKYFNFFHEYVWQAIYIIFVVAVWMLWVEYIVRGRWRNVLGQRREQGDSGNA